MNDKDEIKEFWRQLADKIDLAEWLRRIEHEHRFDNEFAQLEPIDGKA